MSKQTQTTDETRPELAAEAPDQPAPDQSTSPESSLAEMIELARLGRTEVLPALRKAMQEHPELWERTGNLAAQAQGAILQLISQSNLHLSDCAALFAARQREELAGPGATLLERLLIQRVVTTNMLVCFFESQVAQKEGTDASLQHCEYLHARLDQATRRLVVALTALARIRKLLPQPIKIELAVSGEVVAKVKKTGTPKSKAETSKPTERVKGSPKSLHNRVRDFVGAASTN